MWIERTSTAEAKLPLFRDWVEASCKHMKRVSRIVPAARIAFGSTCLLEVDLRTSALGFSEYILAFDKIWLLFEGDLEVRARVRIDRSYVSDTRHGFQVFLKMMLGDASSYGNIKTRCSPDYIKDFTGGETVDFFERMLRRAEAIILSQSLEKKKSFPSVHASREPLEKDVAKEVIGSETQDRLGLAIQVRHFNFSSDC